MSETVEFSKTEELKRFAHVERRGRSFLVHLKCLIFKQLGGESAVKPTNKKKAETAIRQSNANITTGICFTKQIIQYCVILKQDGCHLAFALYPRKLYEVEIASSTHGLNVLPKGEIVPGQKWDASNSPVHGSSLPGIEPCNLCISSPILDYWPQTTCATALIDMARHRD